MSEQTNDQLLQPPEPEKAGITRRGFMIGSVGTGVTMAFVPMALFGGCAQEVLNTMPFQPTIWYSIESSGAISVKVTKAEMGQHIGTALARIVAEELEANWADVSVDHVDTDPKFGLYLTGGSLSVWSSFDALSRAGAAGRVALIAEGAKLMGLRPEQCIARNSMVRCANGEISYAEIVQRGNLNLTFDDAQLANLPLKPASQRILLGKDVAAGDIPQKTNGSAVYGIDAAFEGMVYAKPALPPTRYGAKILSVDDSAAKDVEGYLQTLVLDDPSNTLQGWGLVVAESFHAAKRAAQKIKIEWQAGPTALVSEADLLARGEELIDSGEGALYVDAQGLDEAFASAEQVIEAQYTTSTALHFQLEPVNAIGLKRDGIWELHSGNQFQSLTLPVYAKALGVSEDQVLMNTYLLGGGFGRRLFGDYGIPALLGAKALNRPVKVVFTREDDSLFDSPRSPSLQKLSLAFDQDKKVVGMKHAAAAGWPTAAHNDPLSQSFMGKDANGQSFDPFSINGADHWYEVGAHQVRAVLNDLAQRTFLPGWLRSVAPGWTNWASESFMDEAAHQVGSDPLAFRQKLLTAQGHNAGTAPNSVGGAKRMARVLARAAEKAGWGKALPQGQGMGIACTFGQERAMPTWTACVAQVAVDPENGVVKLNKLTIVIDACSIVHPDGALAQTEGAALWGASLALHEGTEFVDGQVKDTNLAGYRPMRMSDVPELDIEFIESDEQPVGLGEPATTVVAPAIGNAIFAATGARVRHLPIRPEAVKNAISDAGSMS
ncbi:MAG TPA: aldehyde dehydrogenase [Gammaproteobacteria bacterium]|nr:aldehyde dehydrogenase [Gammaproteobacteria bacterium]